MNYTLLALYATLFTWLITIAGSSMVFFLKKINKKIISASYAISTGIMLSASFWSLLNPALKEAENMNIVPYISLSIGFILGGIFIFIFDIFFDKKIKNNNNKKLLILIMSITMHNIPEGLAIGIAFGSVKYNMLSSSLKNAWLLAFGIGLQNFPEGSAISLPLRSKKNSRFKSFLIGSLSAIVEPIFGVIGALLTIKIRTYMPLFLSFAAGAMIYVIAKELIPESQKNLNSSLSAILILLSFTLMMILDIAL